MTAVAPAGQSFRTPCSRRPQTSSALPCCIQEAGSQNGRVEAPVGKGTFDCLWSAIDLCALTHKEKALQAAGNTGSPLPITQVLRKPLELQGMKQILHPHHNEKQLSGLPLNKCHLSILGQPQASESPAKERGKNLKVLHCPKMGFHSLAVPEENTTNQTRKQRRA